MLVKRAKKKSHHLRKRRRMAQKRYQKNERPNQLIVMKFLVCYLCAFDLALEISLLKKKKNTTISREAEEEQKILAEENERKRLETVIIRSLLCNL